MTKEFICLICYNCVDTNVFTPRFRDGWWNGWIEKKCVCSWKGRGFKLNKLLNYVFSKINYI